MKVLHINTFDKKGGAARAAYRIHNALRDSMVESQMVVARKDSDDKDVISFPVFSQNRKERIAKKFHSLQVSANRTYHTCNIFSSGIHKFINKSDVDIVHFHWIGSEFISIREVKKIKKPIVWTLHDMWAFCGAEHYHDLENPGRYKEKYCKKNRPSSNNGRFDIDAWVWRRKEKYWSGIPFHFVTPSAWLATCVQDSALFAGMQAKVIPNCLDSSLFSPQDKIESRKIFQLPVDKKLILFGADGGRSNPLKGFSLLEEALGILNNKPIAEDIECIVFGGKNIGRSKIHNILVNDVGRIDDDHKLAHLYSAADIFVMPSMIEAFGQTLSESMSCSTPCVGFRTTGIPDLIDHKTTGFLAEPFNTAALAEGICWLLKDAGRLIELGQRSRKKVKECYSPSVVAGQYLSLYEKILSR